MPQMQVRIGSTTIVADGSAVCPLRFCQLPGFFQNMPILNPDRRVLRIAVKSNLVITNRDLPLPQIARPICERNDAWLFRFSKLRHYAIPKTSQPSSTARCEARIMFHDVREDRIGADRHHGFGAELGHFFKPRAEAARTE